MEISLPVPEKIFKGFLTYVGMAAILVMGPASCHQIFISLYLKAFIKIFVQIGKVVSEKIPFKFLYVHNLGAPQGFWGSGEKGYLFSGSWGALLIILGELGSKKILLGI